MQVSLNQLVSMLSERAGKPFDVTLQEAMKIVLNYKRANFFKKTLAAHPAQRRYFFKDFIVPLEQVSAAECPALTECTVLRSTLAVPLPIRNDDSLFDFVGDPDKGDPYAYSSPEQYQLYKTWNKYTSNRPRYFYTNNHLEIYAGTDEQQLDYVNVRGVYDDPRQLRAFVCSGQTAPCYTDDDPYEIPDDLIFDIIQDTLKVELRLLGADLQTDTIEVKPEPEQRG